MSVGILGVSAWKRPRAAEPLQVRLDPSVLVADGNSSAAIGIYAGNRRLEAGAVELRIIEGRQRGQIVRRGAQHRLRAGVLPGAIEVEATARGYAPARARMEAQLDSSDRDGDGFPDVLALAAPDRRAFRHWFTFLAEVTATLSPSRLPAELNDCGALLRFAYRESLREHSSEWASALRLPLLPESPSVEKYRYPYTPLGANLFRVRDGRFTPADLTSGAFAQFADAKTLQRLNSDFVSRDIHRAAPGDLLFFRQLDEHMPFHAMIVLGPSHLQRNPGPWVIYHTGPRGDWKGEIRRVPLAALLLHEEPRWRPLPGNPNFLGVYRWKILRETD